MSNGQLTTQGATVLGGQGGSGKVRVDGASSRWLATGSVILGGFEVLAANTVEVANGGLATLGYMSVTGVPGATGHVEVKGENSRIVADELNVGASTDFLVFEEGSSIIDKVSVEGGRLRVIDNVSHLTVNEDVFIDGGGALEVFGGATQGSAPAAEIERLHLGGPLGAGTLLIEAGGTAAGQSAKLATIEGSDATVTVRGVGSQWQLRGALDSFFGNVRITVSDGGVVIIRDSASLAGWEDAVVRLDVSGPGALFEVGEVLFLGTTGPVAVFGGNGATVVSRYTHISGLASFNFPGGNLNLGPEPPSQLTLNQPNGIVDVPAAFYTDTLALETGATIIADSILVSGDGVLQGAASIDLPLVNGGVICPGSDSLIGMLTVDSDYVQTVSGRLCVSLADSTADALHVSGSATLGGTLEYDLLPGSTPGNGRQFEVLIGHPVVGTFDSVPNYIGVSYTDTSVVLTHTVVGVELPTDASPHSVALEPIMNPIRDTATIGFWLPSARDVSLNIFDVSGRLVRRLVDRDMRSSGRNEAVWDGKDSQGRAVKSGVYLVRLESGGRTDTRRMVLLR